MKTPPRAGLGAAAIVVAQALIGTAPARAASISEFSLVAGIGTVSATRQGANEFQGDQSYAFGGPLVEAALTGYESKALTAEMGVSVLIDLTDQTVLRRSVFGQLDYIILGGPLTVKRGPITESHRYSLSGLIEPALNTYGFTPQAETSSLNSTVLETSVGLEYMYGLEPGEAVVVSATKSLRGLYVSGDKLQVSSFDLVVGWRTSI